MTLGPMYIPQSYMEPLGLVLQVSNYYPGMSKVMDVCTRTDYLALEALSALSWTPDLARPGFSATRMADTCKPIHPPTGLRQVKHDPIKVGPRLRSELLCVQSHLDLY